MALQFSDTTNRNGIIQLMESMTNTQSGTVTGSSYSLNDKTRDVNLAFARYMILAISSEGRWQVDDTNQTDYPIIYADIINGQQDYSFLTDANGNQILDIYKIRISDSNGNWTTLTQRDLQEESTIYPVPVTDSTTTGIPTQYDVTANGIFLTSIPNYAVSKGLEIYINRTPTYFLTTDTIKKPGIPDVFHKYLALYPSWEYCVQNSLSQAASYQVLLFGNDGNGGMEAMIKKYYAERNRNERRRMTPMNSRMQMARGDSNK